MKTFSAKPHEVIRQWLMIDASGQTLGKLAVKVACLLRGKHKAIFTSHVDTGDHVVIVNARHIVVTGRKRDQKIYYKHSGYPGGLRERTFQDCMDRDPRFVIEQAVKGMLPRGPLGYSMIKKLKVYALAEHPHVSQNPQLISL